MYTPRLLFTLFFLFTILPYGFGQEYYYIGAGIGRLTINEGSCIVDPIGPIVSTATGQNLLFTASDLAMCGNGLIYTIGMDPTLEGQFLWEINPSTGFANAIGTAPAGTVRFVGAGCDGNGNIYFVGWEFPFLLTNPVLYVTNIDTGVFTFLGPLPYGP